MTADDKLRCLLDWLDQIAKDNDDEFKTRIDVRGAPRAYRRFEFECSENADGHVFVCGSGPTVESAIDRAREQVQAACKGWGYTCPSAPV